jgi:hypothetical protein
MSGFELVPDRSDRRRAGVAIREAVRLEAKRERLAAAPSRANVVAMKPKPESKVA